MQPLVYAARLHATDVYRIKAAVLHTPHYAVTAALHTSLCVDHSQYSDAALTKNSFTPHTHNTHSTHTHTLTAHTHTHKTTHITHILL